MNVDGSAPTLLSNAGTGEDIMPDLWVPSYSVNALLSLTQSGSGTGSVTPNTGTITWTGNSGNSTYIAGTTVNLTAAANSGSTFTNWLGCDSVGGTNNTICTVTMAGDKNVTAMFADTAAPTVSAGSNKTASTQFTQTATATDTNSMTYAWTKQAGPGTVTFGSANALTTTISADTPGIYTIRFTATDAANNSAYSDMTLTWGTFAVIPATVTNGTIAPATAQTVDYNATTSFTLTPATGYQIATVSGCGGILSGNTYTTGQVTADCTVTATFQQVATLLYDDFSNGLGNWTLFGSPAPQLVPSAFGKSDLFDNNGDPNYNSGAVSKSTVDCTNGCTIESEVYLDFSDLAGCWNGAQIGLTQNANPAIGSQGENELYGLWFNLAANGDACWGSPAETRRHSYLDGTIYAEDGTYDSPASFSLNADQYANGWHTLKVEIQADRTVKFYIDNSLVRTAAKKLHPSIMSGRNVILGLRSSGSAGKAYHDWVKVSLLSSSSASQTIGTITFTPSTLAVDGTTTASAIATSGLSVIFTSTTPSICTVSGATVTGVAAGTCTIAANQAGNANYNAASQVTQNISVASQVFTYDDFTTGLTNWTLFGDPQPQIVATALGKSDLFDNNGDPNYNSGAVSKSTVDCTNGCTIESEVYLDFSDLTGCWNGAQIGLTQNANPAIGSQGENELYGLWFNLAANGDACWGSPAETRRHSYLDGTIYAEDGTYDSPASFSLLADQYANGWHTLKVEIQADRTVKFYIDSSLVRTAAKKLHPSIMSGRNVILGLRSSGSAGKAYHDWVKVSSLLTSATQFTVTPTTGTGFTITPATSQAINKNATTSFTVIPATGYGISSVTGCGGSLNGSAYTTDPITADCSIIVTAVIRNASSGGTPAPSISDALKVLQASVGITQLTPTEKVRYDVAPLGSSGAPVGNNVIDDADVIMILRRSIGIGSW